MYIQIVSFEPVENSPLMPAPSVKEVTRISESLKVNSSCAVTDLASSGPIEILDTYRGHILYCSGNVTVYRNDPTITGGQGMLCPPVVGTEEDAHVMTLKGMFKARLNYF
jgi:hypothetical protein